jgi:long-chain fatty acid transport protein
MRAKTWLVGWIVGIIGSLLMSAQCFGAGFALWEGSARGNALGDAVVGRADDPSAVFYNPAGITQLPGLQVEAGATGIMTGGTVSTPGGRENLPGLPTVGAGSQDVNSDWALIPNMYLTYQASDCIWFGLGVFSPYGLSVKFPSDWFGAVDSYYSEVQSVTINPNIAFKINDQLSVAAGFEAMEFGMDLQNRYPVAPLLALDPTTQIKGDTWGYGYNLALHYKPCKYVAMGVSYRSEITEAGDMNAYLRQASPAVPLNAYSASHASITLPDSVAMGVTFYPTDQWSWEVGATWTRWSDFQELQFAFDHPFPGMSNPYTSVKDWHDTWRFQTGVEYHMTPHLDLRAGYIFDQEAIPSSYADYVLPSANRHYFCFGPGLHYGNVSLDLSYTYVLIESRTVSNSSSLGYINPTDLSNENASIIAADVTYRFW